LPKYFAPDTPLSRPRSGSTAPTRDRRCRPRYRPVASSLESHPIIRCPEDQMWEPSSPSEAAKAAALPMNFAPDTPLSRPRRGSTAPTRDRRCGPRYRPVASSPESPPIIRRPEDQMWEPSSPSEAAKAAALPMNLVPDTPLSRPRWGSTAPTRDRRCWPQYRPGANKHNPRCEASRF
jgi:hypothetical protein